MTAIEVAGLRMRYGRTDVLHDVTFQVRPGEVLALLGPNGAGKTTTITLPGGSWQPATAVVVLAGWGLAGLITAPIRLRRMARRESGSRVAARRARLLQRVG